MPCPSWATSRYVCQKDCTGVHQSMCRTCRQDFDDPDNTKYHCPACWKKQGGVEDPAGLAGTAAGSGLVREAGAWVGRRRQVNGPWKVICQRLVAREGDGAGAGQVVTTTATFTTNDEAFDAWQWAGPVGGGGTVGGEILYRQMSGPGSIPGEIIYHRAGRVHTNCAVCGALVDRDEQGASLTLVRDNSKIRCGGCGGYVPKPLPEELRFTGLDGKEVTTCPGAYGQLDGAWLNLAHVEKAMDSVRHHGLQPGPMLEERAERARQLVENAERAVEVTYGHNAVYIARRCFKDKQW